MPTLEEVDEALGWCRAVPADDRGTAWHAYVDSLLAQREQLVRPKPTVVSFSHLPQGVS